MYEWSLDAQEWFLMGCKEERQEAVSTIGIPELTVATQHGVRVETP